VSESVVLLLGLFSGSSISVKARAVLPHDNDSNAHPRILLMVLWSTVFSPYRKISIMQGRDNDNMKPSAAMALAARRDRARI
jgi:hypothetical protein